MTPTSTQSTSINYVDLGKFKALEIQANLSNLPSSLDSTYGIFLKTEQTLTTQRIYQYETDKNALIQAQANEHTKQRTLDLLINSKKEQIADKETELADVRANTPNPDYVQVSILGIFLIAISFFLIIFYSSTGYSAFIDIPKGLIAGFLAPDVFANAQGGVFAFIILFPFLFFGVGYVFHVNKKEKRYLIATAALCFTLLFDCFLAYKITREVYEKKLNAGLVDEAWSFNMILTDGTFYLIILSGFAAYILWGILLNYFLEELKRSDPDNLKKSAIENLRQELKDINSKKSELEVEKNEIMGKINKNQDNIDALTKKINILHGGAVVVDVPVLQAAIGDFMSGWTAFIMFYPSQPSVVQENMGEAQRVADTWLTSKIETLNS